ncbi:MULTISPECIES: hypothetical protein [Amycolatopsis]|uniref:Uncharacterized protein n=1 Tax=Amycolatopsis bullii TaxID=941987 RepID=A0ABQ3KF57_9PSEU|nr:hypothetical protein [Amycolatopsis bullii]GHG12144.1 hypothetical protein GCM10017567_31900 [Amycolatopsis bullii]
MPAELRPHEARTLCAEDPAEAAARFGRMDVTAVRRLLAGRDRSPRPAPGTREVVLTDADGRTTEMAVYTPPGLDGGQAGALVVLHGVGGSGPELLPRFKAFAGRLNMAILCPTAQPVPDRSNRLDLAGLFGSRFDAPAWDLAGPGFPLAALRWARTTLDVHPDRCVLLGTSMGGLAAWNLGMRYWDRFCAVVPVNGALSLWEAFGTDHRKRALLRNLLPVPAFVVHGAADTRISPRFDRESVGHLRSLDHEALQYVEVAGGGHGLGTLGIEHEDAPLFRALVSFLDGCRRRLPVSAITHRALEARHGRAHWAGVDRLTPHAVAEVRAVRLSASAISVRVSGARQVNLHLRSDLFEPGRIDVEVNGTRHVVDFRPDPARLVRSYHDTADPALLDEQVEELPVPDVADPEAPGRPEHARYAGEAR